MLLRRVILYHGHSATAEAYRVLTQEDARTEILLWR